MPIIIELNTPLLFDNERAMRIAFLTAIDEEFFEYQNELYVGVYDRLIQKYRDSKTDETFEWYLCAMKETYPNVDDVVTIADNKIYSSDDEQTREIEYNGKTYTLRTLQAEREAAIDHAKELFLNQADPLQRPYINLELFADKFERDAKIIMDDWQFTKDNKHVSIKDGDGNDYYYIICENKNLYKQFND